MINRPKGIFAEVLQLPNTTTFVGLRRIISFDRPISFHQPCDIRNASHYARGIPYTVYGSIDKSEDDITDTLSDHLIFNSIISAGDSMGVYRSSSCIRIVTET